MSSNIRKKHIISISALSLLTVLIIFVFAFYGLIIPRNISTFESEDYPTYLGAKLCNVEIDDSKDTIVKEGVGEYRLLGVKVKDVKITSLKTTKLYAGGMPFGIKYLTKGLSVIGFDDEKTNICFENGLRLNDVIVKINGNDINSIEELSNILQNGEEVKLTYNRGNSQKTITVKPVFSESESRYTLGLILKNSGAGIGTITYILPDKQYFGGLGHGITNSETGELMNIVGGDIVGVSINGVEIGKKGDPGELKGYFNSGKNGSLLKNTECGVFGFFDSNETFSSKLYDIGLKDEIKEGHATVLTTLDDNVTKEYKIEISNIDKNANGNKCFSIKIVDEELIKKSGGIVQGMSGSPIIQNGKIVGAITHVLINDPTSGYGIFIENMLENM